MKKYISLFFILMMTAAAHAQTVGTTARETAQLARQVERAIAEGNAFCIPWMQTVGDTGLYSFQLSRQLAREASQARRDALQAKASIPPHHKALATFPASDLHIHKHVVVPKALYEAVPYLTRKKDISRYVSTQENQLYIQDIERLRQTVWPQLDEALPRLERLAATLKQPKDPLQFIAQEIPSSINFLLVGDLHGFPETKQAVSSLLSHLRKRYPAKQIILLTEFLPKGFVWKGQVPENYQELPMYVPGFEREGYIPLWEEADKQDIPVAGLEPTTVCKIPNEKIYFDSADINDIGMYRPLFASALGLKYRNEQFMQTIRFLHEKRPHALFVIYAGDGHLSYNAPFSLARELKKEETFTLIINPSRQRLEEVLNLSPQQSRATHPLRDFITEGNFPQNFLYWQDPSLAQIAGFDAFIQLESPKSETEKKFHIHMEENNP